MKRTLTTEHKIRDTVFLSFRLLFTARNRQPFGRHFLRFFKLESASAQNRFQRYLAFGRLKNRRSAVQLANDSFDQADLFRRHQICLVNNDHVGELNLVNQQIDDVSIVFFAKPDFSIIQIIPRTKICLLYTSPSPRDQRGSRMPSSA